MFLGVTKYVVAAAAILSISAHADQTYNCQKDGSVREIRVAYDVQGEPVPCSVIYVKDGSEAVLWTAKAETGYCEEKASNFAEKQRGWGWDCSTDASQQDDSVIDSDELDAEEAVEESTEEVDTEN